MDQQSAKEYGEKIAEALPHIENNKNLAQTDLKEGDGYETLEYLENMGCGFEMRGSNLRCC